MATKMSTPRTTTKTSAPAWTVSATPAIAALAVVCSATALSGVVTGALWLVYVVVAVAVVSGSGVLLRSTRLPAPLVGLGQVFALLCLLVTIFTRSGVLAVLPGPDSLSDLLTVLGNSITEVQTGVPPVADSPAMRCLIMVAIGLVAVLVDTLAVGASAPAASGLVLLCVFAVPASLADEMLPLWTFVFGAAAFALLLAVDGQHRHEAWRGRLGGGGGTTGSGPAATAVASMAVVIALVAGASLTLIGTVGRLPGTGQDGSGAGSGRLGLKPMTELRGMLNQGATRDLFHVRGLPTSAYLRAMTLRQYVPGSGWELGGAMPEGIAARGQLPPQPGDSGQGETTRIEIDPVGWQDNWLPIYGRPRKIENTDDNWRFDPSRGTVYSVRPRKSEPYVLETVLNTPSADQLRKASGQMDVDPAYFQIDNVPPRIAALAKEITANETNQFDRASALYRYFTDGTQGFEYTTTTKGDTGAEALTDFVFNGKTGFCEQYASAMAVMARSIGLPTRVALGFTAGFPSADFQSITTQDAHAWVEVYFPGHGWMVFDPTPLTDGRGVVPPYIAGQNPDGEEVGQSSGETTTTTTAAAPEGESSAQTTPGQQNQDNVAPEEQTPLWHTITLLVAGALALLLTTLVVLVDRGVLWRRRPWWVRTALISAAAVCWAFAVTLTVALLSWWLAVVVVIVLGAATPSAIRAIRRRTRLHAVATLGAQAANAAWEELIAESLDRGTRIPPTETVRAAARRMARAHNLDEQGRDGLRSVVGAIERSWYSSQADADPQLPGAVAEVRRSLNRNAPLALRAKVLPRSVLHPTEPEPEDG